jgi:DNA invertase Pin-like site-specific DNA recombinase
MDVGYARVSSLDQDPQLQINALERAGCWPIYVEHVSGVAAKRPVRDETLAQLQRGSTLTVWKLDRIGRSMTEVVGTIENLVQRGVRFRVLTQNIDTADTSATGKMQLQLLAMFAEFERTLLLERTAAGRQRRKDEGLHPGGPALFGFEADHVTVVEPEAALIRDAAQRVLAGEPMNQIIDQWNAQGLRTRAGKPWTVKTVRRILGNPYVVPVLGQDNYDRLRRIFAGPDRQRLGRPAVALLSGILTCARCGQPLYLVRTQQRDGSRRRVYACRKQGMGGRFIGCGSITVAADRADDWAEDAFAVAVAGPEFAQALDQRQAELLAGDATAQDLDAWRVEAQELDQVQGTRFYTDAMKRRHSELRRMVEQATAQLLAAPDLAEMMSLPRTEEELRRAWDGWTIAQRRTWLRRVLERIEVQPATSRSRASSVEDRLLPVWKL